MNPSSVYSTFPTFMLRTPLLPITHLKSIFNKKITSEANILEIFKHKDIQEAIFIASPNLYSQLIKWLNGELINKKEADRIKFAVTRYLIRMSSRCTPFGLFAGFTLGKWNEKTNIILKTQSHNLRHTRLDMHYLCALALNLAKHPKIKREIKYYTNSSVYKTGNQIRYVEYKYQNTRRTHHIVAVDYSEYLEKILARAYEGAGIIQLEKILTDEGINKKEAISFIDELIKNQLLQSELEPAITGPEFLEQILFLLDHIAEINDIKKILRQTQKSLAQIDQKPIGSTITNYHEIANNIASLNTEFDLKYLFQTDMVKPAFNCTLDNKIAEDILMGIEILNKLNNSSSYSPLSAFRDAFLERYEERQVPLLDALDTESGIGYPINQQTGDVSPLIDDIVFLNTKDEQNFRWNDIQSYLFKKYRESIHNNCLSIELKEKELSKFESRWNDLPDTINGIVCIIKDKENKNSLYINTVGGTSATNLLGRFCHADTMTHDFVRKITLKEEELNPDVVLAEIIHLPESRVGNILLRPVLRRYEIPYLARSAVQEQFRLKPDDLLISVRENRIILFSKKLNKEILPRLSSAHNFTYNTLPVYHFLCDLQTQNKRTGFSFDWGPLKTEYPYLPRVKYKNLILAPATWNIKTNDIKKILEIKNDDEGMYELVQNWRKERQIPDEVCLVDNDNELFLNLNNMLCIKILLSLVKNRKGFQLTEFLFTNDNTIVTSKEGFFTNEFIISFYRKVKK